MGTLWPRSGSMEFDNNGAVAPGALAYFYEAGVTTPQTVYEDGDETTPHEFPLEADGNGRWPAVYVPFGSYKVVMTTSGGTLLSTIDNIPNDAPTDPSDTVDEERLLTTGDIWFCFRDGTRDGTVRLNGRTLGSAASGATERANADAEDLFTFLWNNLNDTSAPVSGGRGAGAAADFAANKTITLPDLRGAIPIGLTTMGNSDSGILSTTPITTGNSSIPGSILGEINHTLLTASIPGHTHTVTGTAASDGAHTHSVSGTAASDGNHSHTISITDPGHTHTLNNAGTLLSTTGGASFAGGGGGQTVAVTANSNTTGITASSNSTGAHTHSVSGTAASDGAHTHSVSGTAATTGGSGGHNNVPKVLTGTWYIKL